METLQILTKGDLLQFKHELLEELERLFPQDQLHRETAYYKSKEVKKILKCSDSTLQWYRQSGKLPYKKVGGTYYYTKDGISELMKSSNF